MAETLLETFQQEYDSFVESLHTRLETEIRQSLGCQDIDLEIIKEFDTSGFISFDMGWQMRVTLKNVTGQMLDLPDVLGSEDSFLAYAEGPEHSAYTEKVFKFLSPLIERDQIQSWQDSYNEDGTLTLYIDAKRAR